MPEKKYAFDLQLYDEIIPEVSQGVGVLNTCTELQETKRIATSRAIVLVLRKKTSKQEYWPRLTKEKPNRNWVKTDFAKVGARLGIR